MTIGDIIRNRRKELNMTQEEVAKAVNTTKATVSRWESGDIHKMKRSTIADLARTLQLDPIIFVQREEILMPEEHRLISAWRAADELDRELVRRTLHMEEKNDSSESEKSII